MTHEEKIEYLRLATGMCQFAIKTEELDLLISTYDLVMEKEGKTNIKDVADVQIAVRKRYEEIEKNKLVKKIIAKEK